MNKLLLNVVVSSGLQINIMTADNQQSNYSKTPSISDNITAYELYCGHQIAT